MSFGKDWTLITVSYHSKSALHEFWAGNARNESRWIVVDNCPGDGSAEVARSLGAEVVDAGGNLGFARANNLALKMCETRFVAFVNPDVRITEDVNSYLEETIQNSGAIVAPQLINSDGSHQQNARGFPFLFDKFAHRGWNAPWSRLDDYAVAGPPGIPYYVAWLMGAAVCGETATFRALGGWNDSYFIYYEDHELGLRAWKNNVSVVLDPRVQWVHGWARETKKKISLRAWRNEIESALRFYSNYPEFLIPNRSAACRKHPLASSNMSSPTRGVAL